jgi:UDP-N-acetylglucosamine 2-epimerase (non-hydrolysing)/GDP/UDP-N,N'-diacetylbacillosamine 2-epimerase (hydrolysing)
MKKRKVAVVSEARATYGYIKRLMHLIERSERLELQLVVTGMHLLKEYGFSLDEIVRDGFTPSACVDMYVGGDSPTAWSKSLGVEIQGLAQVFNMLKPDLVLVAGDRAEILATTVTAAYMNIPVAHIQSGDLSGHIDGSARHAITKLAHIHLPSCEDSAERVRKLGEEPWRIFNVGAPQLDDVVHGKKLSQAELARMFGLDFEQPVLLVIQHPVLAEAHLARTQMAETMAAARDSGHQAVVIYPNVDAAGREIISVIEEYQGHPSIRAFRNLDREVFLSLLGAVSVVIGNSSVGILEAPSFKLPALDIGSRQTGRMRACNVITVPEFDRKLIRQAIERALHDRDYRSALGTCVNPYGDGNSSERICRILEDIDLSRLLNKHMTY